MKSYKNLKIKDWALEDRPREKLLSRGLGSLSDAELIAILIGSGNKYESAVEVARKILQLSGNNLNEMGKLSVKDLESVRGVGKAKAIALIAALELGRRRKLSESREKTKITNSQDAYGHIQPLIEDLSHEEFWVLYLNRSNKVLDTKRISQGGISGTVIDVRIILKNAIELLASSIIICHNHPSGNLQPSESDNQITSKMKEAGKHMDIQILDHLIVTGNAYFSYADEGLL